MVQQLSDEYYERHAEAVADYLNGRSFFQPNPLVPRADTVDSCSQEKPSLKRSCSMISSEKTGANSTLNSAI
jgi:hypothetical protein